jgi:hydrogenase maturation protease
VKRWLVIGVGHPDRGDDAAGLVVAEQLRKLGYTALTIRTCTSDAAQLMDMWQQSSRIIMVDAVCSGTPLGTVQNIEVNDGPLPEAYCHASTHSLGLAEAVEMARTMNLLPPRMVIIGIEGVSFELGAPMNEATTKGCKEAVRQIIALTE